MTGAVIGPVSGYSTQAQISLDIAEIVNNSRIRFWFAGDFNPIENRPNSSPLRIFEELDRAVKNGGLGSVKARNVVDKLRVWVHDWQAKGLIDEDTQARALQAIKTAFEDGGLHPRVFYLKEVFGAIRESEPDEYRVENQSTDDPRIRQILPPVSGLGFSR